MGNLVNIAGKVFGRLTVLKRDGYKCKQATWLCRCSCGVVVVVQGCHLRDGHTQSCGCFGSERLAEMRGSNFKHGHGMLNSGTYRSWVSMKTRCLNPNYDRYRDWGGRGIGICERWIGPAGFQNFLADMGERPAGKTLDRFPDPGGDYGPENCRWATPKQQAETRRPPQLRGLRRDIAHAP